MPGWKGPKAEDISGGPAPPLPRRLSYLLDHFHLLSWGLTSSGMGPATASWADVDAFCVSQRLLLDPWEKSLLVRLATLRATIQAEQIQDKFKADGAQGQNRSG